MRQYVYHCASNQKTYFIYGDYVYRLETARPEFHIWHDRWLSMTEQPPMTVRHGLVFSDADPTAPLLYVGAARLEESTEEDRHGTTTSESDERPVSAIPFPYF